jgi:hypothetical protein
MSRDLSLSGPFDTRGSAGLLRVGNRPSASG